MKIRTGFVSNSSSSSFCIFYKTIDPSEIDNFDKIHVLSHWYEGPIVFNLQDDMKEYLKEKLFEGIESSKEYSLIEIIYNVNEGSCIIDSRELANKLKKYPTIEVFNSECDTNAPYDLKEFKNWFTGECEWKLEQDL